MRRNLAVALFCSALAGFAQQRVRLAGPPSVGQFETAEFVFHVAQPRFRNSFLEADITGEFKAPDGTVLHATGFCDSVDGRVFRLRFAPEQAGRYKYRLWFRGGGIEQAFSGELRSDASTAPGPVVVDPEHPKHFRYLGSGKPFYHLGFTAYHLLDPSRTDAQVDQTIDYCVRMGFNKIRFLLTGYPRDTDRRTSRDVEHGVPDPAKRPNYGAPAGRVNPLPAWEGKPHAYDFTRFHLPYWRRIERAVGRMREHRIVATCIITIEKQDLPKEYGRLTDHEVRLYRYAAARLAAFDNVWWDLGNEHNEFRDKAWGDAMGSFLKAIDPHRCLRSAHAYADFWYAGSGWADYIITQQYGDEKQVHDWVRKYDSVAMPYVNEEYGYEGPDDKPRHLQNADWVRRNHWAIAMAGGYATYGDWSDGVGYFYTGDPGPGKAPAQLRHLRSFFEELPFPMMRPCDERISSGFCLATPDILVFYLPRGGSADLDLPAAATARWYDPRTNAWRDGPALRPGKNQVEAPGSGDWALLVRNTGARPRA